MVGLVGGAVNCKPVRVFPPPLELLEPPPPQPIDNKSKTVHINESGRLIFATLIPSEDPGLFCKQPH
jgi:hypothetical protein